MKGSKLQANETSHQILPSTLPCWFRKCHDRQSLPLELLQTLRTKKQLKDERTPKKNRQTQRKSISNYPFIFHTIDYHFNYYNGIKQTQKRKTKCIQIHETLIIIINFDEKKNNKEANKKKIDKNPDVGVEE